MFPYALTRACSLLRFGTLVLGLVSSGFAADVSFNRDIRPLLSDRCFACHGPDAETREASLRLDQTDTPDGAYTSEAIVPGSLEDSLLWERITTDDDDLRMPPSDSHKPALTAEEIEQIRQWIEAGAAYENFWAFEPPRQQDAPSVDNAAWSEQPIDLFVLQQLEAQGMQPANEADKRTLIRRLTLDLTGLPPTRDEVHAFLADDSPAAYEQLVERLLAREQYGEHMARYWLDLVRFADTNGMHKDFYRNFVSYREWVIRAFNENLGYDDFVRYQLAGDLYPNPSTDQYIASGFNRLHLIIDRGTALPEESHFKNVVDRVTATGTAFMGLTVHCATCHDHKYDPITQKDFYALYAFFNNLDAEPETERAPPRGLQSPVVSLPSPEQTRQLAELKSQWDRQEQALKAAQQKDDEAVLKRAQQQRNAAKKRYDQFLATIPQAMVMKEREDIRPAHLRIRGQYDALGEVVQRDTPGFLPPLEKQGDVASRMDLAEWMVDRNNPLTARVAVNRFWQQLFGVGLVKTSEDLGAQGEVPSHPELLDYLAVSFMDSGWDIKALMKKMVMSQTYRQVSTTSPKQFREDPLNRRLARGSRYRLDAEVIRDQILATSGLLSTKMYGPSVKPPQPAGLWKSVTMTNERFKPDAGEDIYRRSVYTFWKRAMPPPQMTILNAPNRDACIARRERTNTPSQALLLLNEAEYLKAARALALRVLAQQPDDREHQIAWAYEVVTSRLPDEQEQAEFATLLADLTKYYLASPALAEQLCQGVEAVEGAEAQAELAAWTILVNSLYNLDITKNRD
ncbi:PSD1 and planctomycete cytochrome C domain-containing protein [Roseimaritima ulvae]|uniref:Planctomycete cytochrome C n=1 Tax=Roseimaritima ulvae TaxID=980254 RepID=A0A5B9R168_9BACT|nr:PSD1 and planctomycete cytochrome C domain-containing protein [Roseimaritima ulvae]QEG40063.1 Planctomycete cytochrome C [Roseimaritima ulvae]